MAGRWQAACQSGTSVAKMTQESLGESHELTPVSVDAVPVVVTGTVLWAAALLVLLPFTPRLLRDDHGWWLGMCVTGLVLGLLGIAYTKRQQSRTRQESS